MQPLKPHALTMSKKVQICVTECILIKVIVLNIVLTGKFSHLLVYLQSSSGAFQSIPPSSISFRQYPRVKLQEVLVLKISGWKIMLRGWGHPLCNVSFLK